MLRLSLVSNRRFTASMVLLVTPLIFASLSAVPAAALGGHARGFVIPAGITAEFTNAGFQACNDLSWGLELNGASQVEGSKPYGCFSQSAPDVTIGPFPTPTVLRI